MDEEVKKSSKWLKIGGVALIVILTFCLIIGNNYYTSKKNNPSGNGMDWIYIGGSSNALASGNLFDQELNSFNDVRFHSGRFDVLNVSNVSVGDVNFANGFYFTEYADSLCLYDSSPYQIIACFSIDGLHNVSNMPLSVNISSVTNNGNGTYTWHFSSGLNFTTGDLRGQQGVQGLQGIQGTPGTPGTNGINGVNGTSDGNNYTSNVVLGFSSMNISVTTSRNGMVDLFTTLDVHLLGLNSTTELNNQFCSISTMNAINSSKGVIGSVQCPSGQYLWNYTNNGSSISYSCQPDQSGSFAGKINSSQINVTNSPVSGQVLTYSGSNDQFTWANDQTGAGSAFDISNEYHRKYYSKEVGFEAISYATGLVSIWVPTGIASGTPAVATGTYNHPGISSVSSSSTASSGYAFQITNPATYLLGAGYTTQLSFKPITKTGNVTYIHFGFMDTFVATDTVVDGVYFNITQRDMQNFTLFGVTKNNRVPTLTSTNYTLLNNTWYGLEIYITNATSATFKIYNESNTLLWNSTITTTIPTATGRETSNAVVASTIGGTTAQVLAYYDFMSVGINATLQR